jgi:hypothetical protein
MLPPLPINCFIAVVTLNGLWLCYCGQSFTSAAEALEPGTVFGMASGREQAIHEAISVAARVGMEIAAEVARMKVANLFKVGQWQS